MPLIAMDEEAVAHAHLFERPARRDARDGEDDSAERHAVAPSGSTAGDFARMRELEARAGVFNGDALLAERLALSVKLAPLDAIVGPAGVGDAQLKSLLYAIAAEHRQAFSAEGRKVTETAIEEAARSDARYRDKIEEMSTIRTEYVILRALVDNLTSRLQWAMAVMRYAANEPRSI